ncbi:MAG TPA: LytR C-terminal domain-containing protein, partial [Candidatus Eisenbacteria bacterium]
AGRGRAARDVRALIVGLAVIVAALAGSWGWARFGPHGAREGRPGPGAAPDQVIRVQVLNGTQEGGVGTRAASYLREGGFHVIEVKNADRSDYVATLVVARRDDPSGARAVARYLGRPPVILQARAGDAADVTLVIGSDRSLVRFEP